MRRTDRNLKDFQNILQQLNVCDVLHIGLNDDTYPYIVPVSFGIGVENNHAVVYFHSYNEGHKVDLIKKDPHVFIQAEILYSYYDLPETAVSCSYGSIMAKGIVEEVPEEDLHYAMDLILTHCGYEGYSYSDDLFNSINMYKVVLHDLTAQQNYHVN